MWMLRALVGLFTLTTPFAPLGVAFAGDEPDDARSLAAIEDGPDDPDADGGLFGSKGPVETISDEIQKDKTEEQIALEKRIAEIDAANAKKLARVVVLQWRDTDTDYRNETLQRNIKARLARPDAQFFPDFDLYQEGRSEPDKSVRPSDQRATVPASVIGTVLAEVEATAAIPFDGMLEQDWGIRANELLKLADEMWFVDRAELREPLFLLYAQIGRAAENSNQGAPPFFENVDGRPVNYFWYLAGGLAYKDPSLLSKLTTQDLYLPIANYKDLLDSGAFRPMTLAFDVIGRPFDPKEFAAEYEVYVNGVAENVTSVNGLLEVPLGRSDVFLKRPDGQSMSAREERTVVPENYSYLLHNAQKRMGIDFIEQLMENQSECTPQLSGDIVNYLAIYAKLHPAAQIYIAVPKLGSTAPGRIFLWRWDRDRAQLFLVQDNTGGFPVRFAAMFGAGLAFSGATLTYPTQEELEAAAGEPPDPEQGVDITQVDDLLTPEFTAEGAPIFYQLRGHYNRIFMGVGLQYKLSLTGAKFADAYQVESQKGHAAIQYQEPLLGVTGTRGAITPSGSTPVDDPLLVPTVVLRERTLQRHVYMLLGLMLGRDAGVGFGPRGYIRFGWYNAPHALDITAHLGMTSHVPGSKKDDERTGRVRGLLDFDVFAGPMLPFRDSLFMSAEAGLFRVGAPLLTFGFTAGAGLTF